MGLGCRPTSWLPLGSKGKASAWQLLFQTWTLDHLPTVVQQRLKHVSLALEESLHSTLGTRVHLHAQLTFTARIDRTSTNDFVFQGVRPHVVSLLAQLAQDVSRIALHTAVITSVRCCGHLTPRKSTMHEVRMWPFHRTELIVTSTRRRSEHYGLLRTICPSLLTRSILIDKWDVGRLESSQTRCTAPMCSNASGLSKLSCKTTMP